MKQPYRSSRSISCWLVLSLAGKVAARAFSTNSAIISNGTFISVEALDAVTLTTISWTLQGYVAVYFDRLGTDALRFAPAENATHSSSSTSIASSWIPVNESEYAPLPEDLGPGADICDLGAYVVDPLHPFDNEAVFEGATVELHNYSTWWYTSTLGQDAEEAAAVSALDSGSASVLLGDPGYYFACLVPSDEDCVAVDCVEFLVHQPNSDFVQVSSTNIGAIVTVRFNVASFEVNLGDWGWVLAEVDPTFDVEDANAFINQSGSGAVFNRFSEGCWFYFGQATVLSKPFLCSRDPDPELSALQSSTLNEPIQFGSFEFYSAASGNLSIWYALDEQFDFAMVHNYYTCGIDLVPPNSLVVSLESGGILETFEILSISAEPYAPNSIVLSKPPISMAANSMSAVSFSSRDFYSNDIAIGYGDDAFHAWMTTPNSPKVVATPRDIGNGSYQVQFYTNNETGTALFFIQRNQLNIPGSPFESFIIGPEQCVIESLDIHVSECIATLQRTVVHKWKDGITCEGGLALPSDSRISCGRKD
eukprot:g1725.t1